ncbi:hypothetical protein JMJ35_001748 [Cladonia borealis]|uniref:Uncharacterized protein n=1 Tax=Cladonia borealis TaxID=184061 RepID=A0AA39V763_9LECA|nr:hypothetical protein JMJ35_001748 [Cladonia borealis]
MPDPIISHGRGGAGNITPDPTSYADGGIVREGPLGDQGDGSYSAGRGGAGNISSPGLHPTKGKIPGDADVVPETATKVLGADYNKFHVGRGGEGNIHREGKEKGVEGLGNGSGQGKDGKWMDGGVEGVAEKAREMLGGRK